MPNYILARRSREFEFANGIEKTTDPSILENYLTDESGVVVGHASQVVFPKTEGEISRILKEANANDTRVTVSGAGTGITGSRAPLGGIVLSTEKMTHLDGGIYMEGLARQRYGSLSYTICIKQDQSANKHYAIAPPGIPLEIFKSIVESKQLDYPSDPTELTALLGGSVATDASGGRTFIYGATRNYIRRLRIVLANGDVLEVERGKVFANEAGEFVVILTSGERVTIQLPEYKMPQVSKNAAGFCVKPEMDLIDLFIGSEGTLGVISEIETRLLDKPGIIVPIFAHFSMEGDAIDFSKRLRVEAKAGNLRILSIEFFDKNSVAFIRKKYPPPRIPAHSQGIIFFEQEIPSGKELDILDETIVLLERFNVLDTMASVGADRQNLSKEIRHALPEQVNLFVRLRGTHKVATDIAVPQEAFDKMMESYHRVGDENDIPYVIFGHIGDNHLHFNFLPRNQKELRKALNACTALLRKAVELGGTISGEHGVGKKTYSENGEKKPYLELMYGRKGLLSIARIKNSLDPNHILNIGNMIPFEYLECAGTS